MNQRLEQYLGEAEQKLHGLPEARRKEELEEMRQHLIASVAANQELGLDRVAATEETLQQFGAAHRVGNGLQQVWWREQIGGARGLWKTVALAIALRYGLQSLMGPFVTLISIVTGAATHSPSSQFGVSSLIITAIAVLTALPSAASGMVAGKLSPRNAVFGSMIGSAICLAVAIINAAIARQFVLSSTLSNYYVTQNLSVETLKMFCMILCAWLTVWHTQKQLKAVKRESHQ